MSELKQISCLRYMCKTCGKTYKILTWFNKHVEKFQHDLDPGELLDNNSEIQFLKCEIAFLKRQFKELKANGSISNLDPIERIKQDDHRPERSQFKVQFNFVINELKMIFKEEIFDYHEILRPVEPRTTIEKSPILEEITITN